MAYPHRCDKMVSIWKSGKDYKKAIRLVFFCFVSMPVAAQCYGRMLNPVTDICWDCFFPINFAGASMGSGQDPNPMPPPLCSCPAPPPLFIRPGVGVSYWSPDRIAEVVRDPLCSPTLGGVTLGKMNVSGGDDSGRLGSGGNKKSEGVFYQLHWLQWPLLSALGVLSSGSLCQKNDAAMDFFWLSEMDPAWDDDELAFILAPESLLFSSVSANAACAADTMQALATNFGFNKLYWCSGGHGSVFPLSGHKQYHTGGVDSSMNLVHRMIFKLHRLGLLLDTSSMAALCADQPQYIMRKTQYKAQIEYPQPQTQHAHGFGLPTSLYEEGEEYPYGGENWSLIIWRRHLCCSF